MHPIRAKVSLAGPLNLNVRKCKYPCNRKTCTRFLFSELVSSKRTLTLTLFNCVRINSSLVCHVTPYWQPPNLHVHIRICFGIHSVQTSTCTYTSFSLQTDLVSTFCLGKGKNNSFELLWVKMRRFEGNQEKRKSGQNRPDLLESSGHFLAAKQGNK